MSVTFYACDHCSSTDCEPWRGADCDHILCARCEQELVQQDDEGNDICPFCEGNLATDCELLEFALEKLGLTRDQLLSQWRFPP